MCGAHVRIQWPVLAQRLHADRRVGADGELEFACIHVVVRVHAEAERRVGAPRGFELADHQCAGLRAAQPVHIAHIVARLVFAQAVEIEVVVHNVAGRVAFEIARNAGVQHAKRHHGGVDVDGHAFGEPTLVAHEAEGVALADHQRADRQHGALNRGETHRGVLRLPAREHRDAEAFVFVAHRQVGACARGRRGARVLHRHLHMHGVVHAHAALRDIDRRVERRVAEREHERGEQHSHAHEARGEHLMPAERGEQGQADGGAHDRGPAERRDVGGERALCAPAGPARALLERAPAQCACCGIGHGAAFVDGRVGCQSAADCAGAGTSSRICATTCSAVSAVNSASDVSSTRWASTGTARALTSSGIT